MELTIGRCETRANARLPGLGAERILMPWHAVHLTRWVLAHPRLTPNQTPS